MTVSTTSPGWLSPRSTVSCTSRPTISSARSSSSVSAGMRSPTTLPRRMTVIRSAISSTSYSLWLMKMMLCPSRASRRRTAKISFVSCGRQDGRRLVEDEDPRLAVERLEDLDALLPADRQSTDLLVRVDLEAEPLAQLADPPAGLVAVEEDRVRHRLVAQQDVLGDRQDRDQHEVLVDHADAPGDGIRRARRSRASWPSSRIWPSSGRARPYRMFISVRLAGPVLAEERVDLARADVEVDAVVGHDARVALGDPAHLEGGRDRPASGRAQAVRCVTLSSLGYDERADAVGAARSYVSRAVIAPAASLLGVHAVAEGVRAAQAWSVPAFMAGDGLVDLRPACRA